MGLLAGTATTSDSMAKNLYDETNSEFGAVTGALDTDRRRMCEVIARAVTAHIKDWGDVIINPADSALQQADIGGTPGQDTLGPAGVRTLVSAID